MATLLLGLLSLLTGINYGIDEPVFTTILTPPKRDFAYEVRGYGSRVAVETKNDDDAFGRLASYIGVFGTPENQAASSSNNESIDMTAPVVTTESESVEMTAPVVTTEPVYMDMTAPVVTTESESVEMTAPVVTTNEDDVGTMQFILPAKYKAKNEAPTPTNDDVWLLDLPPSKGAVYKYTWFATDAKNKAHAETLIKKINSHLGYDLKNPTIEYMGYNAPFTNPLVRRNEVWISLTDDEIADLEKKFTSRRQMLRSN